MLLSGTAIVRSGIHCTAACDAAFLRCYSTYLSSLAASTTERSGTHARASFSRSAAPTTACGLGGCGAARHSRRAEQQTQHLDSLKENSTCRGAQGIACLAHQADPEAPEAEEVSVSCAAALLYCAPVLLKAETNSIGDGSRMLNAMLITDSPVSAGTVPFLRPFSDAPVLSSLAKGRAAIGCRVACPSVREMAM